MVAQPKADQIRHQHGRHRVPLDLQRTIEERQANAIDCHAGAQAILADDVLSQTCLHLEAALRRQRLQPRRP
eukprot:6797-Prymnesium_polylepis.2